MFWGICWLASTIFSIVAQLLFLFFCLTPVEQAELLDMFNEAECILQATGICSQKAYSAAETRSVTSWALKCTEGQGWFLQDWPLRGSNRLVSILVGLKWKIWVFSALSQLFLYIPTQLLRDYFAYNIHVLYSIS